MKTETVVQLGLGTVLLGGVALAALQAVDRPLRGIVLGAALALAALGVLGAWVAAQRGRSVWEGLVLGLVYGPLGVLVEALLPEIQTRDTGHGTREEIR